MFVPEKNMFEEWLTRLRHQLPGYESSTKANKSESNKFVNIPGTELNDIIGYAELDLFYRYHKWLRHHKLHKYLYFFANLSYTEIQTINADNIDAFEEKIDLHVMTTGARNAIVKKLSELNQRAARLEIFCMDEYFTCVSKLEKSIHEIKCILKTPVKKDLFAQQNDLPRLIKKSIETVISATLKLKHKQDFAKIYDLSVSLLKMAWGCYYFDPEVKDELNRLQSNLHSRLRSYPKKNKFRVVSKDINGSQFYKFNQKTIQFDIERGIRAITWYLENVILIEEEI